MLNTQLDRTGSDLYFLHTVFPHMHGKAKDSCSKDALHLVFVRGYSYAPITNPFQCTMQMADNKSCTLWRQGALSSLVPAGARASGIATMRWITKRLGVKLSCSLAIISLPLWVIMLLSATLGQRRFMHLWLNQNHAWPHQRPLHKAAGWSWSARRAFHTSPAESSNIISHTGKWPQPTVG